jgi:hypothetical protein
MGGPQSMRRPAFPLSVARLVSEATLSCERLSYFSPQTTLNISAAFTVFVGAPLANGILVSFPYFDPSQTLIVSQTYLTARVSACNCLNFMLNRLRLLILKDWRHRG